MPGVKFSKSDLLATTQLEGNWYRLVVREVSEWAPGKADPTSNNITVDFQVAQGPKAGIPIRHWFSEKSIGTSRDMLPEFLAAFTATGKLEEGKEYEVSETKGKEVDAYVTYDSDMKMNKITSFRRIKQAQTA